MDGRAQAHLTRPRARTNKFFQSFSQFRGIIRLRVKDERGADQFPYPSPMDTMRSNTTSKPYISQPTFELEGGVKNSDGELSKLSGLSERLSSRNESTPQKKSTFDQDFPLRTHPRSSCSSKKSDPSLPESLKLPSHFNKSAQSPNRVAISFISKAPSELPPLMEPINPLTSMTEKELITDINPNARPDSRLLTGRRRSSTTNSLLTTATTKTSGPLVKLKQSFSQLQAFKSDVTGQLISPKSTNTHAHTSSPTVSSPPTSSPSLVPVSRSPTSTIESSLYYPPVRAAATSTPIINPTKTTTSYPRPHHPDMIVSGALAPMSFPKNLPHPGNIHRRSPAQPPKLDIPPTNPRLSLTISPTLMTNTGPARFSPTVISRPMPLPLSNLPTLMPQSDSSKAVPSSRGTPGASSFGFGVPVRSMSKVAGKQKAVQLNSKIHEERRVGKQKLKSMPALPIQGSGRGVKGHEESDDMEDDDSLDDEDEDEDEDEGQSSRRFESSGPTFFTPDMNADGFRPSFDNLMCVAGHVTSPFISNASASAFQQMKKNESDGTSSSGSSYHSVLSGVQLPPAFSGSSVGSAQLLNEPTPPRAHRVQYMKTSPFLSESQSADSSSRPQISYHDARLPEVDTSSLDTSFLSAPSLTDPTAATISVDVKGKGKAKDLDLSPTPGTFTPLYASATITEGTTRADHIYDPSRTPIMVTNPSTTSPSAKNQYQSADTSGTGALRVLNAGRLHSRGQGSSMTSAAQSFTGTIQQAPLDCGVGKNGSDIDYFTAKRPSLGFDVDVVAGLATTPPPASVYSHSNPRYPSLHSSVTTTISSHPHFRNSVALSPSPTSSRTSRSRADGFLGDMSKPQKNSTLMMTGLDSVGVVGGVHKHDVRIGNFGEQVFTMPQLYKRMSRSQVDLHTIEMMERKRLMEAEMRAEEELQLAKIRERERSSLEHEDIVKEAIFVKEGSSYDKVQEDDGDDNEVVGKSDQIPPAVPAKAKMDHSPVIAAATTAITANAHDNSPSAFSSTSNSTTLAATKRQNRNRLSTASHYLRRRRSMPVYDESSEPPPYPSFAPHPSSQYKIMPREDEGRECLPSYTNPIYLKAIMPRKMEFSSFGVQARDRKWRRVMCVLDGTILRVYKCPPGYAGVGVLGEWWERQVGAGDVSSQPSHSGVVSKIQIETRESRRLAEERRDFERQVQRIMKDVSDGRESGETDNVFVPPSTMSVEGDSTRSRTGSNVSLQQNPMISTSSSSKLKFAQFLKPGPWYHTRSKSERVGTRNVSDQSPPRPSLNITNRNGTTTPRSIAAARSPSPYESTRSHTAMSNSSLNLSASNSSVTGRETPSSSIYGHQHRQGQQGHKLQRQFLYSNREISFIPDPDPEDLLKEYTLQNAESGIGNDYLKRKNVIRLRLEGEQFLLQARDVTGVVEWIEALQAATNISLDLDERPMPRGPLFPRRRRRRRPLTGLNNDSSTIPSIQAETTTVLTPSFTTAIV